jgi:hypothetical protein
MTAGTRNRNRTEWRLLLKQYRADLTDGRLEEVAKASSVSADALSRMGVGYCAAARCYTFPLRGGTGDLRGVALIDVAEPAKLRYLPGTRAGLFIPTDYRPIAYPFTVNGAPAEVAERLEHQVVKHNLVLLVLPTGPLGLARALDRGFRVVGFASLSAGIDQVKFLLGGPLGMSKAQPGQLVRQDVVVVAADPSMKHGPVGVPVWPGIETAVAVCEAVLPHVARLRFVVPRTNCRDWIEGPDPMGDIERAPVVTYEWIRRAKQRLAVKRELERRPIVGSCGGG